MRRRASGLESPREDAPSQPSDSVMREMRTHETERLHLEPLVVAHAAEMFWFLTDARIYRFIPHEPPPELASVIARFETLEKRGPASGDRTWLNWVARAKADRRCIGRVEVTLRLGGSAYFAYEIAPALWGQGFATEACSRIVAALFADYDVVAIVAEVDTRNLASIRLVERLGFQCGPLRPNADFFKGAASDEYTFTLVRSDPGG
jgi:ribosomal-protein-alanine N-acetyltransferase